MTINTTWGHYRSPQEESPASLARIVGCLFVVSVVLFDSAGTTNAQETQPPELAAGDLEVIDHCLDIIRGCQLPDGAFTMVDHGDNPDAQVWIAPYFVQHSMLALLAANDFRANAADVDRVRRWLEWCVSHQAEGGFWYDYTGTNSAYQSNGHVDAHDSSAAMFLMVLRRYQQAKGDISAEMQRAAKAALGCIQNVTDADGLTWARPDYKVKYLMDNVEVYAGLVSAEAFFRSTGDVAAAEAAGKQAAAIEKKLPTYWEATEQNRFAWVQHADGVYESGLDRAYPHGLAQLFGVAFVAAEATPFGEVVQAFPPQTTPEAAAGVERYLIASTRVGAEDAAAWQSKTLAEARTFTKASVYMFRPGLTVLGLLEGADWMPSLLDRQERRPPGDR